MSNARPRRKRATGAKETTKRVAPSTSAFKFSQVGLVLAILGCTYGVIALVSYEPTDPSFTQVGSGEVQNIAGPLGAWTSDILLQVLGYGAWSLLGLAGYLGLLLAGRLQRPALSLLANAAVLWSFVGAAALVVPADAAAPFPAGGLVGLVTAEWLLSVVGPAGSWIVLIACLVAALPFLVALRWDHVAARLVGGVEGAVPRLASAGAAAGRLGVGKVASAGGGLLSRWRSVDEEDEDDYGDNEDGDVDEDGGTAADPFAAQPSPGQRPAANGPVGVAAPAAAGPAAPAAAPAESGRQRPRPTPLAIPIGAEPAVGPTPRATWPAQPGPSAAFDRDALAEPRTQVAERIMVEVAWDDSDAASLRPSRQPLTPRATEGRAAGAVAGAAGLLGDAPPLLPAQALAHPAGLVVDTTPRPTRWDDRPSAAAVADPTDAPEPRSLAFDDTGATAARGPASAASLAPSRAAPARLPAPVAAPSVDASYDDDDDDGDDDDDDDSVDGVGAAAAVAPGVAPRGAVLARGGPGSAGAGSGGAAVGPARLPAVRPGDLSAGGDSGEGLLVGGVSSSPFELPHLGLLDSHDRDEGAFDEIELHALAGTLEESLGNFGVRGEVVAIRPGPVVTTFEYLPAPGIKLSKISTLSDDIAMALKALCVRIVAPIPGKGVVGVEIPNKTRQPVWIRDILVSDAFRKGNHTLPVSLGKSVEGKPRVADLGKMPHLLVGGTTGAGKSVGVNAMLLSLLYTRTPEEMRLILIDPKMLEFELYHDIPHLLHPVVTEPKLASAALKWACTEMDQRYRILSHSGTRNIASYNRKIEIELQDWSPAKARRFAGPNWPAGETPPTPKHMPYIVIVIDELADLMMVAAKDVESSIIRLAQKARAAGIHLIVATQRPSVDVITGLIKANMPSRIAFQVRSKIDGRTILDQNGAENLLGKGDMLYLPPGVSAIERVHGPFVSDEEVRNVTDFLRAQGNPSYDAQITVEDEDGVVLGAEDFDEHYDAAVNFVIQQGKASASMVQRQFKIGYNRASRIIDIMEMEGVVGPADGARPREVLVGRQTG